MDTDISFMNSSSGVTDDGMGMSLGISFLAR